VLAIRWLNVQDVVVQCLVRFVFVDMQAVVVCCGLPRMLGSALPRICLSRSDNWGLAAPGIDPIVFKRNRGSKGLRSKLDV
jgi:hypothetical protein